MPRVKRGNVRTRKRRKVLETTKGFKWRRKSVYRLALEAKRHAMVHAYTGRKQKKHTARALWQIKIAAAARQNGTSYSRLINALKENNIGLDRKILAHLAEHEAQVFKEIVAKTKK